MILLLAACAAPPSSGGTAEPSGSGDSAAPPQAPPPAPRRAVGLALGERTTCLLHDDDLVVCRGALGQPPLELYGAIEADDTRLCARSEGKVRCARAGLFEERSTPFVELAHGGGVPCGRDAAGQVYCLSGRDRDESDARLRPVPLPEPAARVVADGEQVRALLRDGRLFAWDPFVAMVREPVPQLVAEQVLGIDATYLQTCWWTASSVRCTGRSPRRLGHVERVAVGRAHACALAEGRVTCWGDDRYGQTRVPELADTVALDAGDDHTCALGAAGDLRCWGRDDRGQLWTAAE